MMRLEVAGSEQCLPEKWPVRRWRDHSPGGRDNQLLRTMSLWKEQSPALAFERRQRDDRMMNFNGPSDILNSVFHLKCTSKSSTYRTRAKSFKPARPSPASALKALWQEYTWFPASKGLVIPFRQMASWWPEITLAASADSSFSGASTPGCTGELS